MAHVSTLNDVFREVKVNIVMLLYRKYKNKTKMFLSQLNNIITLTAFWIDNPQKYTEKLVRCGVGPLCHIPLCSCFLRSVLHKLPLEYFSVYRTRHRIEFQCVYVYVNLSQ